MKFLSIDIETTGLDRQNSQILQLAAVWVDGDSRKQFNQFISHESFFYSEPFAMQMNQKILKIIATDPTVKSQYEVSANFTAFLAECTSDNRIVIAGKNAAGFDIPILKNQGFDTSRFSHKVIDPGSLWLPDFGYVPSLGEINAKLGRKPVSHDALEDCEDVVAAVLAKVK